jgi:hypothetical protein
VVSEEESDEPLRFPRFKPYEDLLQLYIRLDVAIPSFLYSLILETILRSQLNQQLVHSVY